MKSLLFDRKLLLNVNLYQTRVKDYQQTTSIVDELTTRQKNDGTLYYQSVLGNVPELRARGVEFDAAYNPTHNLTIGLGGAYNDAIYTDWHTATCPAELNITVKNIVCDNTGKTLVAAPKFIGTLNIDYKQPVFGVYTAHVWGTNVYRTRQNFDVTLSRYGWQEAYSVADIGIGIAGKDASTSWICSRAMPSTKSTRRASAEPAPTASPSMGSVCDAGSASSCTPASDRHEAEPERLDHPAEALLRGSARR